MTTFEELPPGESGLLSARPGPDLAAAGYVEREYVARGTARPTAASQPDGKWPSEADRPLRHPGRRYAGRPRPARSAAPWSPSGSTVSSGSDAAPDWTYLADEIVRRGHAWVGVSAQHVGRRGRRRRRWASWTCPQSGLRARRGTPRCTTRATPTATAIYASVVAALDEGPLADLVVDVRLAVGESQSAFALTTFVNGVHPLTGSSTAS